jgi:hypothetical protein
LSPLRASPSRSSTSLARWNAPPSPDVVPVRSSSAARRGPARWHVRRRARARGKRPPTPACATSFP